MQDHGQAYLARDIENLIITCSVCNSFRRQQAAEPLLRHSVPDRPWQKVGVDISSFKHDYLLGHRLLFEVHRDFAITGQDCINRYHASQRNICKIQHTGTATFGQNAVQEPQNAWICRRLEDQPNDVESTLRTVGRAERAIQTVKNILQTADEAGTDPQKMRKLQPLTRIRPTDSIWPEGGGFLHWLYCSSCLHWLWFLSPPSNWYRKSVT